MSMGVRQDRSGHWEFSVGVVEKWVVSVGALILVSVGYWFTSSVTKRLDDQSTAMAAMATQQAVTNTQLVTLTMQLADLPTMSREMAEIKVRVNRHDEDLRELRGTRGLK